MVLDEEKPSPQQQEPAGSRKNADGTYCPEQNADYLNPGYWDQRFSEEEEYEWCRGFRQFQHLLLPHLQPESRILIIGSGNSMLPIDLYHAGFTHMTATDLVLIVL